MPGCLLKGKMFRLSYVGLMEFLQDGPRLHVRNTYVEQVTRNRVVLVSGKVMAQSTVDKNCTLSAP